MRACGICGNEKNNRVHSVPEMHIGTRENFEYLECADCGALQIVTVPGDMTKYYSSGYYSMEMDQESAPLKTRVVNYLRTQRGKAILLDRGIISRVLNGVIPSPNSIFHFIRRSGVKADSRVLDIGCGSGSLLYDLSEMGFRNTLGIDPFIEKDLSYRNGLKILKKDIAGFSRTNPGKFDLVMLNHSLEHMTEPASVFKLLSGLLSDTGTLLVRTPATGSYAWKNYGTSWVQLDAPRHFFIFSERSLKLLGEGAGLALKETLYDSTEFQFWGSEQYRSGIPLDSERSYKINRQASPFTGEQIAAFREQAARLNAERQGDQVVCYFNKRS